MLCIWHMKRSVKQKIKELRRSDNLFLTPQDEEKMMNLLTIHYNTHPLISEYATVSEVFSHAVDDIINFLDIPEQHSLKSYLLKNWYTPEKFQMWERRNENGGIPFARTTMMVESHWSLLKRRYLLFHNRPRVDFVVYIMEKQLLPSFRNELFNLKNGGKKPTWWK